MVSYEPLWRTMKSKNITTYYLIHKAGFSAKTIDDLKHNRNITMLTAEKLCNILNCTLNDIAEFLPDNPET